MHNLSILGSQRGSRLRRLIASEGIPNLLLSCSSPGLGLFLLSDLVQLVGQEVRGLDMLILGRGMLYSKSLTVLG